MENKGKLKIFFGYSAGVGKTYQMLKQAQKAKKNGIDIVVGYLERHDRPDTIKMSEGLEFLDLKEIDYKGIVLKEFDVDLAIKRKPEIILVDELAHTNAYGSKNKKRWIDVLELLNNGIDVWTTLNVQHIEGVHEDVNNSTAVDVNERIPDEIFDLAEEIILIDIEPDKLIQRMKEGKIYKFNKAQLALENFFKEDNLSSLRELYLRRYADKIEKQNYNGELKTKILVLISPSPSAEKNIRIGARMAEAYHSKFQALYVETDGELSDESAANLKKHYKLVNDLGGEIIVKYGDDIVETVIDYARISGITDLVIGKTWYNVKKKNSLEDEFILRMPNVQILVVPCKESINKHNSPLLKKIKDIFKPKRLLRKYKISNLILDIHNAIERECLHNDDHMNVVANILATTFKRSVAIYSDEIIFVPYKDENIDYFKSNKELGVVEWVKKNNKMAGKGSDTLCEAKAIYIPLITNNKKIVIAFSCLKSKLTITEKLIFSQLESLLKLVL